MNPYEISSSVPTKNQESKDSNKMEGKACKRAHDSSDCDSKDSNNDLFDEAYSDFDHHYYCYNTYSHACA